MRIRFQSYHSNDYFVFTLNINERIPAEHRTGEYGSDLLYADKLLPGLPYAILAIDGIESVRILPYSIDFSINPAFTPDIKSIQKQIVQAVCTHILPQPEEGELAEKIEEMEPLITDEAPELYTLSPFSAEGWNEWEWDDNEF